MSSSFIAIFAHGFRYLPTASEFNVQQVPPSMEINMLSHAAPGELSCGVDNNDFIQWVQNRMRPMLEFTLRRHDAKQSMILAMNKLYEENLLKFNNYGSRRNMLVHYAQDPEFNAQGAYYQQDQMQSLFPSVRSYPNKFFSCSKEDPVLGVFIVHTIHAAHVYDVNINLMNPPVSFLEQLPLFTSSNENTMELQRLFQHIVSCNESEYVMTTSELLRILHLLQFQFVNIMDFSCDAFYENTSRRATSRTTRRLRREMKQILSTPKTTGGGKRKKKGRLRRRKTVKRRIRKLYIR